MLQRPRGQHLIVRHRRVLDGRVLPAGTFHPHRAGGHHQIAALTSSLMPPQMPTRTKVSAPTAVNSSSAMTADGPPMPVDTTLTFAPSSVPV